MNEASHWPRWMDVENASRYVSMPSHKFLRAVATGTLPQPSRTLGKNTPRWDKEAIDAKIAGDNDKSTVRAAFDGLVAQIQEDGRARSQAREARRIG